MAATAPDRRAMLALLLGAALASAEDETIASVLARMAGALSDANAHAFLRPLDPEMPGYARLADAVRALVAVHPASSSVEVREDRGSESARTVKVNWILQQDGVRREQVLTLEFERPGKRWRIVKLEPVEFFAPPAVQPR